MALQDLTPQLRTRLNRVERAVGWFLFLATALLVFGFGYYIYKTAENKGWFKNKARYYIFTDTAKGLNIGDPVFFWGKSVGSILDIEPMPPRSGYNIYIEFQVLEPYYGYIWTEGSSVKVNAADFLGKRQLEISRGTNGYTIYIPRKVREVPIEELQNGSDLDKLRLGEEIHDGTNVIRAWTHFTNGLVHQLSEIRIGTNKENLTELWVIDTSTEERRLTAIWNEKEDHYEPITKETKAYGLLTDEQPDLTDRLQGLVSQAENALPNILALTNKLNAVLSNTAELASNLNAVAASARPAASNLAVITANLREPEGSLGEWLLPTNLHQQLAVTLTNADTNLTATAENLGRTLDNLASITSNLNAQVQANSNMLAQISNVVVHSDEFVQGLKRNWLFRSSFKAPVTNAPSTGVFQSPRAKSQGR
jgi:ABC-type transporter Mla subunit MlaD